MALEIVAARPIHLGLAHRLRDIDILECRIMGMEPKEALRWGLRSGLLTWTALIDGRPEAMFGVSPISTIEGRGRVWLLMTDEAAKQKRALVRLGWRYSMAMHQHFPILENYVYARNDMAIRWLARLGFAVGPVDVINGFPMRGFIRCADLPPSFPSQ